MIDIDVHERIVVGAHPIRGSESTVRWAARHAARSGLGLTIAMAYPDVNLPQQWRAIKAKRETKFIKMSKAAAEQRLAEVVELARAEQPGLDVNSIIHGNDAAELLVTLSTKAHLVVVGTHSVNGVGSIALGGIADTVLVHSKCSVAAVPREYAEDRQGPVVVGVDEDTRADTTVALALAEAAHSDSDVIMVNAWQIPASWGENAPYIVSAEEQQEISAASMEMLTNTLAKVAHLHPHIKVTKKSVCAIASEALAEESKTARVIYVGNRGRGGFAGLLLGSTCRQLARQSQCPVIVVRVFGSAPSSDK